MLFFDDYENSYHVATTKNDECAQVWFFSPCSKSLAAAVYVYVRNFERTKKCSSLSAIVAGKKRQKKKNEVKNKWFKWPTFGKE